jgi:hypothetical protein
MRWTGHVTRIGETREAYEEGKRPLERPRRGGEDNIKMDMKGIDCNYVGWIHLAQDRNQWGALVNTTINLQVP